MTSTAAPPLEPLTALDPCVHCGFCLPACPTYLATGDESDSPRGRIVLMRALERGELAADDPAATRHLERCLGCRACEPACPSGVEYGRGLEVARAWLADRNGIAPLGRLILAVFRRTWLWRPLLTVARWFRATGLPAHLAGSGRLGFGMGMLAASGPCDKRAAPMRPTIRPSDRPTVALLEGCVMSTLFSHVNAATERVLQANGHSIAPVARQRCCGALHAHAGDLRGARALAAANVAAFSGERGTIVVNSAGCGAMLKDYGHLLGTPAAHAFAARVRDISEVLADDGPLPGAPLRARVAYDAPCHLQHAQRVHAPVLRLLAAVPELTVEILPGSDRCCGSAGIYSLLEPELSRAVLAEKAATFLTARPAAVVTGNPGCLMQIGAGLRAAGNRTPVRHPVELLDESYQAAGLYR
ncbi:MAG: (Fe-S)-binding protein [Gemmatimonadales bacterium]|jgi:glycolate oxidase iron-sulfur subunit